MFTETNPSETKSPSAGKAPKPGGRLRLNLRMIATVDFRQGVPTHYEELKRRKLMRDIGDDETILLVSQTGLQLAFVFREVQIKGRNGDAVRAIAHYRLQLDRHTPWSPIMLTEYASQAGIELVHVKRFEDHLRGIAA
jgi:hypothetical protein